eukprot:TRINITY_DN7271_c0_g1_i1.p1 TRINITY_DN7271_c0_g1~~TRINITY_DN7271_c0_g1_i1.p1  ORF type:complete len:395 (+),score=85.14 TRINITY_DN7271_c0_g1_i1:61-1245(+)
MSQVDELLIPFKVKIVTDGTVVEIRRLRLNNPTIEAMLECCESEGTLQLQYEDEEGDMVSIKNEIEWRECIECWKDSGHPVLKLTVICENVNYIDDTANEPESPDQLRESATQFEHPAARQIAETIYGSDEVYQLLTSTHFDGKLEGFGGWLTAVNDINYNNNTVLCQIVVADEKMMVDEVITFVSLFEAEKQFDSAIVLLSLALEIDGRNYELWYSLSRMEALSNNTKAMDTATTAVDLGLPKGRLDNDPIFDSYRKQEDVTIPQHNLKDCCRTFGCFRIIPGGQRSQYCCGKCRSGTGHTKRCVNKTANNNYEAERAQLHSLGYVDNNQLLETFEGDINAVIESIESSTSHYQNQLVCLHDMGFIDRNRNLTLLTKYDGDVSQVAVELMSVS